MKSLSDPKPTEREIWQKASEEIRDNWMHWNPVIVGITQIPYEEIQDAHPLDLVIFDQVARDRREYQESLRHGVVMLDPEKLRR